MVLKPDTTCEGLVDGATLGDLGEAYSLCGIEIALDMNIAGDLFNEAFIV